MHKRLPANMSLSALIKSVKEILLFAINSMQFAEFILHFLDTISHSHTARQIWKTVDVATLSNRRLECKGKWTGFNLIFVYLDL